MVEPALRPHHRRGRPLLEHRQAARGVVARGRARSRREKWKLAAAAELLPKEAFDGGLHKDTEKSAAELLRPAWINQPRAASRGERGTAELDSSSSSRRGTRAYEETDQRDAAPGVLSRVFNQMTGGR